MGFRWLVLMAVSRAILAPDAAYAQLGPSYWDADERVLIADFQRVTALARASDRLFAAAESGLLVRNEAFGRWELPVTAEDGYPQSRVTAMAWDRRDGTLWLATADARLLQLDTFDWRFVDDFRLSDPATRILVAPTDPSALLIRQASRWSRLDPFSRQVAPIDSREADRAIASDPYLSARRALISDPRFEASRAFLAARGGTSYAVTDVMPSMDLGHFWLSSYGGFLFRYDSFSGRSEPVDYGLAGQEAAAVEADGDVVWFAPARPGDRYAVSRADLDLQEWKIWEAESIGPRDPDVPADPVRAFVRIGSALWTGGERGLYRFDGESWHREAPGLAAGPAVLSMAEDPTRPRALWIGTERGLYRLPGPGARVEQPLLATRAIHALATHDGTLWIGTDFGLATLSGASGLRISPVEALPAIPVLALAAGLDALYAGAGRDVWVRDGGSWRRAEELGLPAAPVTALEERDGTLFVGTAEGLTAWDRSTGEQRRFLFATGDLPTSRFGETGIRSVAAPGPGIVWLATPAGAVRLDLDP